MRAIQVCWYTGKYPNHEELDNALVITKYGAYKYVGTHRKMALEKWGQEYNYRIVDLLNRFQPIFFEPCK
jgi:hypothetical protein